MIKTRRDLTLFTNDKTLNWKKRLLLQNNFRKEAKAERAPVEQEETEDEGQTLQQQDVSYGTVILSYLEREGDVLMLYEKQGEKCFIGCEGQTAADYCMPVRKLTYDGIEYSDQCEHCGYP